MGIFTMYGSRFGICLSVGVLLIGCSNKGAETEGSTAGDTEVSVGSTASATEDSTGEDPTGENPTSEDPTGESPTGEDPTGEAVSHRICELYLNCLAVIAPTELPSAQQGFGPDGTCWQGTQESAEQCLMACATGLETWHEADPTEPACGLCQAQSDCPDDLVCQDGECKDPATLNCGNGIVDPDEVCDGGTGCDPDCQGPAECSPVTHAGCTGDDACVVLTAEIAVDCQPSGDLPGPAYGDPCLDLCAGGSVCASAKQCPGYNCCITVCDLTQPDSCPQGTHCDLYGEFYLEGLGLDYVGTCQDFG